MKVFFAAALTAAAMSATYAEEFCDQWGKTTSGNYIIYNNLWGSSAATGGGKQCTSLNSGSGDTVSWRTTWSWQGGDKEVKSYANAALEFEPVPLTEVKSIPSTMSYKVKYSGKVVADVAYDLFTSSTAKGEKEFEIMICLAAIGGAGPISSFGKALATTTIAGTEWSVYSGPNGQMMVYSFVASKQVENFEGDLMEFFNYLVKSHSFKTSQYLIKVECGTEPFIGKDVTMTVSKYSATVNTGSGGGSTPTQSGDSSSTGAQTTTAPSTGSSTEETPSTSSTGSSIEQNPSTPSTGSSTEDTPSTGSSTEETPSTGSSTEETSSTGSSTEQTPSTGSSTEDTPSTGSSTEETPSTGSSTEKTPSTGSSTEQTPSTGSSTEDTPSTGSSTEETPSTPSTGSSTEETPFTGSSTENTPSTGSSTEETPTTGSSAEETPSTGSSTEQTSPTSSGDDDTTSSGDVTKSSGAGGEETAASGPSEETTPSATTAPTTSFSSEETPSRPGTNPKCTLRRVRRD
ncbi:Glycosyl hydrolase family 12 [Phytophthora infestans]|uniref:Glycosyl hydrolase family 12 n=1 Tax=Phytophthora infestans TaxID=4787 RepID=A0A8S9V0H1_PHYIN|nr:Glycosyl hydrolase family 12 [Phytophthora infestans]